MGEGTERLSVARRLWSPPARFADWPLERRVTSSSCSSIWSSWSWSTAPTAPRGPSVMVGRRI